MPVQLTYSDKVRIQFRESLRKTQPANVELDPVEPPQFIEVKETDETIIVRVGRASSGDYSFTDSRILANWTKESGNFSHLD